MNDAIDPMEVLRSFPQIRSSKTPELYETLFRVLCIRCQTGGKRLVTADEVSLFPYLQILFAGERTERAVLLLFDGSGTLVTRRTLGFGTEREGYLDLSRCLKGISHTEIVSAMLAHKHPGGTPALSGADRETASRISEALRCIGVRFDGQIILSDNFCRMYSCTQEPLPI